ncbi:MAG: lipid A deacylase LpxR family protein [Desulfuromusa sp.]
MGSRYLFLLLLILILPLAAQARTAAEQTFDSFTLHWENDAFTGTDRDYTNGFKLTWSTPYERAQSTPHLPGWSYPLINHLPFVNDPDLLRSVSVSIGQDIYTPEDSDRRDLIVADRPYAGWTYLTAGLHGIVGNQKMSWGLTVGVLGPLSLAEDTQNFTHNLLGLDPSEGWDNQLENELTVDLAFESQWRWLRSRRVHGFGYDLIPHLGGRIGTTNISANAGAEMRFGWNLPNDFGSCPIRVGCETNSASNGEGTGFSNQDKLGFHFFTAIDGKAILRDIYLDGNTFRSSHSVDKKPFVADIMAGIAWRYKNIKTTYSYIYRTKQFKTQTGRQAFGSLSVAWSY